MNVLGLKIEGHDPGAALIWDGGIVAIAEERLNRIKHARGMFPRLSIDYCLQVAGLRDRDIHLIVIDHTSRQSGQNIRQLFFEKTGDRFKNIRIEIIGHHDAHAAAAFLCSPFKDAAILVYDGRGSMVWSELGVPFVETESLFRGTGNSVTLIDKAMHTPVPIQGIPQVFGIGMLYDRMCHEYLGFGRHDHGKMMGLAPYGDDRILKEIPINRWVIEQNGHLVCNGRWVYPKMHSSDQSLWSRREMIRTILRLRNSSISFLQWIIRVLTKRTSDQELFAPILFQEPIRDSKKVKLPNPHYSSAAYAAQKIFEYVAEKLATRLQYITQSVNLCVSGGCALNIDANRNFLTKVGFKDLFVQPASSDCGIALGCALWGKHIVLQQPRDWVMRSASLGRKYTEDEIENALEKRKDEIQWKESSHIAKETAKLVADGKIIGWFQGGSEYGPRALGNRSILCDASRKDMRDVLNARVKHREMWRPFAASVLEEKLEEWFDLKPNFATRFMLLAAEIPEEKRTLVPSIVHVDNTCRMQTLTKEDNGIYYDLVKEFEALTGIPLILNTSFNLGGDPIVETPEDALSTFLKTDMDFLVLESYIVWKKKTT